MFLDAKIRPGVTRSASSARSPDRLDFWRGTGGEGVEQMLISRTTDYAIRAAVLLAREKDGKFVLVKDIARQEKIPAHFLAKILQRLARRGILASSKGPTGGFRLGMSAGDITLASLVESFGVHHAQPPYISDEITGVIHEYLERTTIAQLACERSSA
jgi:Rrf2 family protein